VRNVGPLAAMDACKYSMFYSIHTPNAAAQPLLEAGAQRTL
jgi:hypothetical protein